MTDTCGAQEVSSIDVLAYWSEHQICRNSKQKEGIN